MWYFMAGMEGMYDVTGNDMCEFGLMTFLSLNTQQKFEKSQKNIKHILIDSGAYSFRHGEKHNDFDGFCNNYIEFIKRNNDNPKIIGFFELDIDNIVGYDKVLEYRKKLEEVSDKIIPVWHNNRGIKEFYNMCQSHSGRRVAVATVGWHDMRPKQLNWFINVAHKFKCKIHVLGMTNKEVLKDLNLGLEDSFDSVGWILTGAFANLTILYKENKIFKIDCLSRIPNLPTTGFHAINFKTFYKLQLYYMNIDNSVEVE